MKNKFEVEDKDKPHIMSIITTIIVILISLAAVFYCVIRSPEVVYDGDFFQIIEWDGKQYIIDRNIFGGGMKPYEP